VNSPAAADDDADADDPRPLICDDICDDGGDDGKSGTGDEE